MDVNILRIVVTGVAFTAFLGIVLWAYRPAHKRRFEDQGRSILEDREP